MHSSHQALELSLGCSGHDSSTPSAHLAVINQGQWHMMRSSESKFEIKATALLRQLLVLGALSFGLGGCATSSDVVVNRSAPHTNYTSAYVVTHGGNGADMDALIKKELVRHGLNVSSGSASPTSGQLRIEYVDEWKWDVVMYLRSLDVTAYDDRTQNLLATASWKNSAMHGFHSKDTVVADVVSETLKGAGTR
jgi:hypothetical protein